MCQARENKESRLPGTRLVKGCYSAYNPLPAGHGFVVGKDLVSQLVDKLIKTQVNLVKRKRGGKGSVVPVWINRRNVGSWECTRAD